MRKLNKAILALAGMAVGLSCAKSDTVASRMPEAVPEMPAATQAPETAEPYHVIQPVGISYAEVWSNSEQLRVSIYGTDIEGNKLWELRWSRFEGSHNQCLFEQFYAMAPISIRAEGLWEIIVTDNECNGSVDSVVEFFNRQTITDETTWEGIDEYMAGAREIFSGYPCNFERQADEWHQRQR